MVQGISPNTAGYPVNTVPQTQAGTNTQPAKLPEQALDEFVSQLEAQHKKGVRKKNILSGSITAASILAMLGGAFMKGKWGRLLSIAPLGLTALGLGVTGLVKGNKTPDFKGMIRFWEEQNAQNAPRA